MPRTPNIDIRVRIELEYVEMSAIVENRNVFSATVPPIMASATSEMMMSAVASAIGIIIRVESGL